MTVTTEARPVRADGDPGGPRASARIRARAATAGPAAAFLLPAVAVVALVLLVPLGATIYRSFHSDAINPTFTGLDNYSRMLSQPEITRSLVNTVLWVVGSLLLPVVLGLAVAVMTNAVRWGRVARLAVVLPYAISGSAVAIVGNVLLRSDGAINQLLTAAGLDALAQDWLLSWPLNALSTIGISTWQSTGVAVILFLVGLQTIPPETVEAAALDGAAGWKRFRHVILPQLRPVTVVVVGITLANALKTFDLIWVLTQGGPARSSETLAVSMYRESFLLQRAGGGAAIAVVLAVVVVAASWIYLRGQLAADPLTTRRRRVR